MDKHDFYTFSSGCRIRSVCNANAIPLLNTICEVKFQNDLGVISPTRFSDEFREVNFLRPRLDLFEFPASKGTEQGISNKKLDGFTSVMRDATSPHSKMNFCNSLFIDESSSDLVSNRD